MSIIRKTILHRIQTDRMNEQSSLNLPHRTVRFKRKRIGSSLSRVNSAVDCWLDSAIVQDLIGLKRLNDFLMPTPGAVRVKGIYFPNIPKVVWVKVHRRW